jgi:hypothetical protein
MRLKRYFTAFYHKSVAVKCVVRCLSMQALAGEGDDVMCLFFIEGQRCTNDLDLLKKLGEGTQRRKFGFVGEL